MDNPRLTRLLVRLAGLFIIVTAIGNLPTAFVRLFERNGDAEGIVLTGILAGMFLPPTLGLLLYTRAGAITNRVFAAPVDPGPVTDMARVESAALFVLGCYMLCYAIFDGVYVLAKLDYYFSLAPGGPIPPEDFGTLCANGVKLVVALAVIGCSRGIVVLKNRLLDLRGPLHEK